MCGITGVISKNKAKKYLKYIEKSLSAIKHRGYDHSSYYCDDNICFGYNRLAIRGLNSTYNQPILVENSISFANGEVYYVNNKKVSDNKNDLDSLVKNIILNKEEIYNYIDADFALCIYDKQKEKIIIARDYFGIKPLFYIWLDDDTLAFSSEIIGLKELIDNTLNFNINSISDYLIFGYPTNNKTFYEKIYAFPPRTMLEWDLKSNKKEYYSKKDNIKYTNKHSNIYKNLQKAVVARLVSDRNIGAHLSGGYDSSSIAYIAKDKLSYITAYNSLNDNDLLISKLITDDIRATHMTIKISEYFEYEKLIKILSSPIMSPGAFVPYEISKHSSEYGKKVLLAGQGPDELFLGYDRFINIKNCNDSKEFISIICNSDLDMLKKLFNGFDFREKYLSLFDKKNFLAEGQEFYLNNFLTELLHIEDATHMNFNIENRVPYLSLPIRKFIQKNGIYILDDIKKDAIYNMNLQLNSKALIRKNKENMNRDLFYELKKFNYDEIFSMKIFDNFDYKLFGNYISNLDLLNKKELFAIWTIYNLNMWYKINGFQKKIRMC